MKKTIHDSIFEGIHTSAQGCRLTHSVLQARGKIVCEWRRSHAVINVKPKHLNKDLMESLCWLECEQPKG